MKGPEAEESFSLQALKYESCRDNGWLVIDEVSSAMHIDFFFPILGDTLSTMNEYFNKVKNEKGS